MTFSFPALCAGSPWERVIGDIELVSLYIFISQLSCTVNVSLFLHRSFHSLLMGPKFCSAARLRSLMSSWLFYSCMSEVLFCRSIRVFRLTYTCD
ncbi:hypothetical protein K435DRAFT_488465 [Dendrothele bispora CBS 962.96]|uniref:Uncharacterized protein n=1 Tax=Dendrothele bispora (strain CBS 962.96) TaxID=1314807 RepID=A0A4S8MBH7_DENBC|nr:hypothetical protein K435DRAFT_488465 [Dendrothele bispora CBS 962.96]